jgi:hypothetical protein
LWHSRLVQSFGVVFGRFFIGAGNRFWNVLLREDTQVWENDVLMITRLQAYKTTRDALKCFFFPLREMEQASYKRIGSKALATHVQKPNIWTLSYTIVYQVPTKTAWK